MMALGVRGDSGGYRRPLCYNFGVHVVSACQDLLADPFESFGIATGFGKPSAKKNNTTYLRSHQVYIKMH